MPTRVGNIRGGAYRPFECRYIGRPGKFGNPFQIGKDGTREEVIEKYRVWLRTKPKLIAAARKELKGFILLCWCVRGIWSVGDPGPVVCHGQILALVAEGQEP